MKTVAMVHGWAGGNWHVRRFKKALIERGYKPVDSVGDADIAIAHSIGSYKLKGNIKARLILIIGPPYWPGRHIVLRAIKKKGHDTDVLMKREGFLFALGRLFFEAVYVIFKPRDTYIALKNHGHLHFFDELRHKKVILVRNQEDFLCSPELGALAQKYKNVRYIELPGGHDNFMIEPKPYIDLLDKDL